MTDSPHVSTTPEYDEPPVRPLDLRRLKVRTHTTRAKGLLAGMRIRKKLLFLHTIFSLGLAGLLVILLRPAIGEVLRRAESEEARTLLEVISGQIQSDRGKGAARIAEANLEGVTILRGPANEIGLDPLLAARAAATPWSVVVPADESPAGWPALYVPGADDDAGGYYVLTVKSQQARSAVTRLYVVMTIALLGVYFLVALALEAFVLPRHVYEPIRRMLAADYAVQEGRPDGQLIPESAIPADELGEIMRSRNDSILALRRNQAALAEALGQLEAVANDLKRKNHLLETARQNLADADRLASLGMMSAGIAHELNTPLAVLKGLVERLDSDPRRGTDPQTSALMVRVVRRLEKLGDSLLDFARVRPAQANSSPLHTIIEEAATLVRLDRDARDIDLVNNVSPDLSAFCDADRIVQVMVNLMRNAIDAIRSARREPVSAPQAPRHSIVVTAERSTKGDGPWVLISVTDTGPGIDPEILPRLFEPFASTRLDSRGTGLGLAVAEGIVREHGGVILARNRSDRSGAVFEIMLPAAPELAATAPRTQGTSTHV